MILDGDGRRSLLARLRADPEAQRRFRAGYTGRRDPLDLLRWQVEPDADDHPDLEVAALQRVVHARPGTSGRDERRSATARLRELADPADEVALDEAVRAFLQPDVPPSPPRYPWFAHPATWFGVGLVVAVAAAAAWVLVPRELGGGRQPADDPLASSLNVFEREQTGAEGTVAAAFASYWGEDFDEHDLRLIGEHEGASIYVLRTDDDGEVQICLASPSPGDRGFGWSGACVPEPVFGLSGIGFRLPSAAGLGEVGPPADYVHWGPVGSALHIVAAPERDGE